MTAAKSMDEPLHICTMCGEQKTADQVWFLLAESHWDDRLRILQWQDEVAQRRGIHRACCPEHVQEMVIHWMTTGSLDFPFATMWQVTPGAGMTLPVVLEPDTRGARQISELAVHRESVRRVLAENPESLQVILNELSSALQRESETSSARLETGQISRTGLLRLV